MKNTVKRTLLLAVFCATTLLGFGAIPTGYYDSAAGKSGDTLKTTLRTITGQNYKSVGYSKADGALSTTDENPNNTSQIYNYYKGMYVAKTSDWNKEHLWPQSLGCDSEPMRSDLHHLFPENSQLNSSRGNLPFGIVSNPTKTDSGNKWNSSLFEPRDDIKGNIARAVLYMEMRYSDRGFALVDTLPLSTNNTKMAVKSTLVEWNRLDPPDDNERRRNDLVYGIQKNRNPYVDHPEYVDLVFGITPIAVADNDTLSFSVQSVAPETASASATDIAMLKLTARANTNEWDLASVSVANTGAAALNNVKLWRDSNANGILDAGDTIMGTADTFSNSSATITCAAPPRFTNSATTVLFVTATPASATTSGTLMQLRLNANSALHSSTGGNDVDPTFTDVLSNATTVTFEPPPPVPTGVTAVINKIYNSNTGNGTGDMVELLILQDNTSLVGLWLKDFSGSGANDNGGGMQFKDVSAWKGLHAGTLIVLTYNSTASGGQPTVTGNVINADLNNSTLFTIDTGAFNLGSAEIVMLKSGTKAGTTGNIHAMGYGFATATQWTGITEGWKTSNSTTQSTGYVYVKNTTRTAADFNRDDLGFTVTGVTAGSANNSDNQAFIDSLSKAGISDWNHSDQMTHR